MNTDWGRLRTKCWEEYLDLWNRKWHVARMGKWEIHIKYQYENLKRRDRLRDIVDGRIIWKLILEYGTKERVGMNWLRVGQMADPCEQSYGLPASLRLRNAWPSSPTDCQFVNLQHTPLQFYDDDDDSNAFWGWIQQFLIITNIMEQSPW
jgi:hypothetical protein